VLRARERAPTFDSSVVFCLGLTYESFKELGVRQIDTHYLGLMICLIDFQELKCLVGLTYAMGIIKFELQKGMKKRPLVAQGMAHTSSW